MEQQIRFDYSTYIGITMQRNWKEEQVSFESGFKQRKSRRISEIGWQRVPDRRCKKAEGRLSERFGVALWDFRELRILKALSRLALWSVILSCVGFLKTKTRHISRKVLDTSAQYSARFRKCTVYQQPLFSPSHTHVHTTHTAVTSNSLTCATHIQTVTVSAA